MQASASVRQQARRWAIDGGVAAALMVSLAIFWSAQARADTKPVPQAAGQASTHETTSTKESAAAAAPAPCLKLTTLQVMQLMNAWRAGLASGDAAKMASFYTDNATLVATTDGKPVTGRDAIRDYYAELMPRHPQPRFLSNTISIDCNTATVQGVVLYRITGERKGTRMLLGGRYKVQFAYQKNFWQISNQSLAANPRKSGEPIASL